MADAEPLLDGARRLVESARGRAGNVSGMVTLGLVPAVAPLLSSRLYGAVQEEGVPDQLLDLLEKLDNAEQAQTKRTSQGGE